MRGYACIALDNPKSGENVGGAMRAAMCFGAVQIVIGGERFKRFKKFPTDTMRAWRHIPTIEVDDVFAALPHDCVPVAVEHLPMARPLAQYIHPERAFYVFGAEDATLGERVLSRCRDVVWIPTNYCLNLAAAVNVVLYDRMMKRIPE